MEDVPELQNLEQKYTEITKLIVYAPHTRARAIYRFLLIKGYEEFLKRESKRLGKKCRRRRAIEEFCHMNGLRHATLYRYIQRYLNGGIEALVSTYGLRNSKGPVADTLLPIIRQIIEPGKGYKPIFDKLVAICEQKGIKTPIYETFRHIVIANGLSDVLVRKKSGKTPSIKPTIIKEPDVARRDHKSFKIDIPKWIRILNKRAFNIAICKYCLVLPFLDPDLERNEKNRLLDKIINRKHQPLPGVTITMNRATLLRCISMVKKNGFDGLTTRDRLYTIRRYKNTIWAGFRIDMDDPLACIAQLKEIIEDIPATSPDTKAISLRFLTYCAGFTNRMVCKYSPIWLDRPLRKEEIKRLQAYRIGRHRRHRDRAAAILMAHDNCTMLDILMAVGCTRQTVYKWLQRFKNEGVDFIETKRDYTKNNRELRERKNRIVKILHHSPNQYGINRTAWVLKDVARVYEKEYGNRLSWSLIRLAVKDANYSWKSARRVLTSPDPEYREKTKKVLDTLRSLGPNDAFFFIDEAGPSQVKQNGGKTFTEKGEIKIYPQFQTAKGRVTFIGALDALRNQVTMFFTKRKDTSAVICLIKILFYKYHSYSTLYLTWDCASWHSSKGLQKCLNDLNSDKRGPTIKVVPLPKRSQFLNVIESVFSGMKHAVIFNSDYQSEYEMKMAISRHFQERNEYFKANPKRAGKKIWDKEYYNLDKIESGLFRRM